MLPYQKTQVTHGATGRALEGKTSYLNMSTYLLDNQTEDCRDRLKCETLGIERSTHPTWHAKLPLREGRLLESGESSRGDKLLMVSGQVPLAETRIREVFVLQTTRLSFLPQ